MLNIRGIWKLVIVLSLYEKSSYFLHFLWCGLILGPVVGAANIKIQTPGRHQCPYHTLTGLFCIEFDIKLLN